LPLPALARSPSDPSFPRALAAVRRVMPISAGGCLVSALRVV
jgi:hypothetical protein